MLNSNLVKSGIVIIAGLLIFILLALAALGPFISLYRIQVSLEENNHETLEKVIDFPVLRENFKSHARQNIIDSLGIKLSSSGNIFESLALSAAEKLIDVSVESAVTPLGISLVLSGESFNEMLIHARGVNSGKANSGKKESPLLESERFDKNKNPQGFVNKIAQFVEYKNSYDYKSFNEFVFYLPKNTSDQSDENKQNNELAESRQLVFLRSGFCWKLSNIVF